MTVPIRIPVDCSPDVRQAFQRVEHNRRIGSLNKLDMAAKPGATDDESAGFSAGSVGFYPAGDTLWQCTDATKDHAVWENVFGVDEYAGTSHNYGKIVMPDDEELLASAKTDAITFVDGTGIAITNTGKAITIAVTAPGVTGPGSSTDNAVARFHETGGATIQNSGVIIDDSNNITGVGNFSSTGTGHDQFSDFKPDEHVPHADVFITAGAGMTGGGTIQATRTLNVIGATSGGITVNPDSIQLDIGDLATDTIASGDHLAFDDITGGNDNKITFANFEGTLTLANQVGYSNVLLADGTVPLTGDWNVGTGQDTITCERLLVNQSSSFDDVAFKVSVDANDLVTVGINQGTSKRNVTFLADALNFAAADTWQCASLSGGVLAIIFGEIAGTATFTVAITGAVSITSGTSITLGSGTGIADLNSGVLSAVTKPAGDLVGTTATQTLTNKTLTTPTIGDFTNATHDHADAAGGGSEPRNFAIAMALALG